MKLARIAIDANKDTQREETSLGMANGVNKPYTTSNVPEPGPALDEAIPAEAQPFVSVSSFLFACAATNCANFVE